MLTPKNNAFSDEYSTAFEVQEELKSLSSQIQSTITRLNGGKVEVESLNVRFREFGTEVEVKSTHKITLRPGV